VFFDDTQLEVSGKKFEGAAINYNGDLALSWQTLWVGPLLCDSHVGGPKDASDQLLPRLEHNRAQWKGVDAHFYADSGGSAGQYLDAIAAEGWHYTVSYNKWTGPLERTARGLPALAWKKNGDAHHAFLRHQPEGRSAAQLYAVSRRRDGLFDRYGFIACDDAQNDAALVGERHHLKSEKEHLGLTGTTDFPLPSCGSEARRRDGALPGGRRADGETGGSPRRSRSEEKPPCSHTSGSRGTPLCEPFPRQHESHRKDWRVP